MINSIISALSGNITEPQITLSKLSIPSQFNKVPQRLQKLCPIGSILDDIKNNKFLGANGLLYIYIYIYFLYN